MSAKPIILTGANIQSTSPNTMTLKPGQKIQIGNDEELALINCFINYSWFNISSFNNNNTVGYTFPTSGSTVYPVNFGNVFLLVSDVSSYIQQVMIANGHYLINNVGEIITYFSVQTNYSNYGVTITFTPLPATLPTGWSNPAGLTLSSGNAKTPQLVFNSAGFADILGFNQSTSVPATPASTTVLVNNIKTPQLTPTAANFITCNLVNDPNYNTYGNVIHTFTPNVTFGAQIIIEPSQLMWYHCTGGIYDTIQIKFYDGNFAPLQINDKNIILQIAIRKIPKYLLE